MVPINALCNDFIKGSIAQFSVITDIIEIKQTVLAALEEFKVHIKIQNHVKVTF